MRKISVLASKAIDFVRTRKRTYQLAFGTPAGKGRTRAASGHATPAASPPGVGAGARPDLKPQALPACARSRIGSRVSLPTRAFDP